VPDGQIAPTDLDGLRGEVEHTDVVIVGAGLSGIGMACRLVRDSRRTRFVILETRDSIGGTWDLFRYPGVRSDSDMHTLGYGFRPWRDLLSLAPASAILEYVKQTATEYRIDRHIRFNHRVRKASFSSSDARWTLEIETAPGVTTRMTCDMLLMCGGYYSYEEGHAPKFPGAERFRGKLVHPQFWPSDLDYAGKNVVVIGSGATAVTLVPAMAKTAAHVTMLQRSPTYIVSRPSTDKIGRTLRRFLPHGLAGRLTRAKNIGESLFYYKLARAKPADVKRQLIGLVRKELGREYDVAKHFTPTYNPWDQRVCLVPDSDLFKAIRSRKADIVTDKIKTFTETGIELESGETLPADVVVSATGLKVQPMGGASLVVDGVPVDIGRAMTYKGMMLSDVPNFVFVIGYTNASWTLKSDLVALYTTRLLNYMRRRHVDIVVAPRDPKVEETPLIDFSSGYVQRASATLPKQGNRAPWTLHQNYLRDMPALRFAPLKDGTLRFAKARRTETV
jgi:cation diffusion facilitator CzcD-associated flavoprotein CzcO